jgi:serine/threonine protein kinase
METETRIDDLINRWEELRDRGTPLTIEELCSDWPELAAEVRRRIAVLREVDSALDTEVLDPRPVPGDRARAAAEMGRGLAEVVRATATYRPRGHHDHGGLGVVFTAHQDELDRTVALKRIRPDRLHAAARRRFLREAALTARLQHPGIVPIYGLGEDDAGPFYTMPFIRGRTLQEAIEEFHGDEALRRDPGRRALRFRELLQQFVAACNTVAYAHDQGVVHRDLKPSNLMLGPYGETLVLDWGLAKRLGDDGGAAEAEGAAPSPSPWSEAVTATGEVVGTPQYMSPEQARGEPAGPAGDIFCMGLVLYAILTGKSAFEESSFRGADRLRAVREAAIVPPRTRDPGLPRGLEAICLKAVAARAEGRYATARMLGEDVTRWLADEPVTAWREPASIRARRWMRRHRTAVAVAVATLLAAVIGLAAVATVLAWANSELKQAKSDTEKALAQSEESRKQAEAVSQFLVEAFRSPDPSQTGREVKVADLLDRASERLDKPFAGSQTTKGALLDALGRTYLGLGLYDQAVSLLARACAEREAALGPDHPNTLLTRVDLGESYRAAGRTAEAIALHQGTLNLYEAKLGPYHAGTLKTRNNLAIAYAAAGRLLQAIPLFEETLKLQQAELGPVHPDTLMSRNNLAEAYRNSGRPMEAIALHEETLELRMAKLGPDDPLTLSSRGNLAIAYAVAGRLLEAIPLFETNLKLNQAKMGPDHPDTLMARNNLSTAYAEAGRMAEAIPLFEETFKLQQAKLGPDHPDTLISRNNLALAHNAAGRTAEAIALHEETLKLRVAKLGPDHPHTLVSRNNLAGTYELLGRWAEAESLYREVLTVRRKTEKPDSPLLANDLTLLGSNLLAQSRWSEAEPVLREAAAIRERATADDWRRYDAMSLLGGALLGQGRHAEAEPSIVAAYEGMKAREAQITAQQKLHLRKAAERVVHLYEGWGRPEEAAAWKARLGMPDLPADVFAPP